MQGHPFLRQITVYSTLRHTQKVATTALSSVRTVPKQLSSARTLISGVKTVVGEILNEAASDEPFSVRIV
jgi:hypothetical protein